MDALGRTRFRWLARSVLVAGIGIGAAVGLPHAAHGHAADGRPARIHEGSCGALGRVTAPLTGVGAGVNLGGTPIPEAEIVGAADAVPLAVSTTTLEVALGDLMDTPHAIVVYAGDEAMDQTIACGAVGGALRMQMPGMPMPGDELDVWLDPEHGSGVSGLALLRSEVGGGSTVSLIIAEGSAGAGASAATPPAD